MSIRTCMNGGRLSITATRVTPIQLNYDLNEDQINQINEFIFDKDRIGLPKVYQIVDKLDMLNVDLDIDFEAFEGDEEEVVLQEDNAELANFLFQMAKSRRVSDFKFLSGAGAFE